MEEEKNNNNNIPSDNQENILKQEIKFIQEELKIKIEEHKKLKDELKNVKNLFHNGLNDYAAGKNTTIEKEREIETLLSKISKMRKTMFLSINQTINKKFYIHLLEISSNKEKEKILLNIFNFLFNIYNYCKIYNNEKNIYLSLNNDIDFEYNTNSNINKEKLQIFININNNINKCQTIKDLLTIIRNETEIKNILLYSYDIFKNLQEENIDLYNDIKNSFFELFNEINSLKKQYPFDFLFDFIKNIFSIIDNEKQVEDLKELLNKLVLEKNKKFIEVKNIESIIKKYNKNIKIISNYIKALKKFYYRIKDQNKNKKDIENNNKNKNNSSVMKELIDDIEKFKKFTINYDKINNFDAMTSLSFGTNYTLSEKSSIKSSNIDSKNNHDEIDNENNNNERISNINERNSNIIERNSNMNETKNNELCLNLEKKNSSNLIMIKKENKEKNNKKITKIQKKSLENKILNKTKKLNNSFFEKRSNKTMKKNISLTKHNIGNITTTDNNINNLNNRTQFKKQYNMKTSNSINNKKYFTNKSNISYNKEIKNKNTTNKPKPKLNNGKKKLVSNFNPQKMLNKEIKKRFNSNINNNNNNNNNKNSILNKNKNISQTLKSALNIKNNTQILEPKNNNDMNKDDKSKNIINKIQYKTEKDLKNENKKETDKNSSPKQPNFLKLFSGGSDKNTEKEFENRQFNLSLNPKYDLKNNKRYNISKKIEQLKQKEPEESIEITMPNKDNNMNEDFFDSNNNIKDSICDEMVSNNFGTANSLIRSTTNDYINRLGFKNNVLWSENLYKNKAMKFKSNFKKLNIEKPIDTSSCCAACT